MHLLIHLIITGATIYFVLGVLACTITWLWHSACEHPAHAAALIGFLAFMLLSALTPPSPPRPWPQPTYQQQQQPIMTFSQRWAFTEHLS
jgi:hypothetical protein